MALDVGIVGTRVPPFFVMRVALKHSFDILEILVLHDDGLVDEYGHLGPFVAELVLSSVELLLDPNGVLDVFHRKKEIGAILGAGAFAHVLAHNWSHFFHHWLYHINFDSGGGDRGETDEDDRDVRAFPFELIVVADHIGPSGWV